MYFSATASAGQRLLLLTGGLYPSTLSIICRCQNAIFGRIVRLREETPAHKALRVRSHDNSGPSVDQTVASGNILSASPAVRSSGMGMVKKVLASIAAMAPQSMQNENYCVASQCIPELGIFGSAPGLEPPRHKAPRSLPDGSSLPFGISCSCPFALLPPPLIHS